MPVSLTRASNEISVSISKLCCTFLITDRVCSTTLRYCFHRCLSVHTWGGGYSGQVQLGGYPPWVPPIGPGQGATLTGGVTPPQVPPVRPAWGYTMGVPNGVGVPWWAYLQQGYPSGTPQSDLAGWVPLLGVLHLRYPPPFGLGRGGVPDLG